MALQVLVVGGRAGSRYRVGRTIRALRRAGLTPEDVGGCSPEALSERIAANAGPIWLVRAGAWPTARGNIEFPLSSAFGQPLIALGRVNPSGDASAALREEEQWWELFQDSTGGEFAAAAGSIKQPPAIASAYLETKPMLKVAQQLARGESLAAALAAELANRDWRVVRHSPLDVYDDEGLRIIQVVTSLQQGGAERIAVTLTEELRRQGQRCLLASLGWPTRTALASPPGTLDLSPCGTNRHARIQILTKVAHDFAADVVHGHLLDGEDARLISANSLPLVLTIHNVRQGWPQGTEDLRLGDAGILIACAQAVETQLAAAKIPLPLRTVWNGIVVSATARNAARRQAAADLRSALGIGPDDIILLALANPRPQKRLPMLSAVLAATRTALADRGITRQVRLLIVGEASRGSEAAARIVQEVETETIRLGLRDSLHWAAPNVDPAVALAAADVLVSTSAYEGLSLAQLEALSAGIPVVATDVGGTAEIAWRNPAVTLVQPESSADAFANEITDALTCGDRSEVEVHDDFVCARMAERCRWLYPRVLESARIGRKRSGLLLVTNNFSTGGAQSSARRLLMGLANQQVRVRACVLQERADLPTVGRRALAETNISVAVLPPAGTIDAADAVAILLERLDEDPPEVVLFWNALAEYKVLLADALFDIPVFDVSPGEMYYASLDRYFSKPRPGLPYRTPADYGARLAGVIVKYREEASRAAEALRAPVHVIPNGVPIGTLAANHSKGPLAIGTVARINPQKKLEDLLAALRAANARLPQFVLRIAGGVECGCESYAAELRQQAAGLPVEWVGELSDASGFLQNLDVFVMVAEPAGCPNASLEAMAAGLPVIITDVGGASEQVEDGITGRVVPRGNTEAFALALIECCQDSLLRVRWGTAGRERALERFCIERMVDDYRRVCLQTAAQSCSSSMQ